MDKENRKKKYFAAANGYNGFTSYFDSVFRSENFERVFILKGGPGTGKSSFMKKISTYFFELGCDVDEIYCSSDPKSLDGVICKHKDKSVALLDGTSPHERDALFPGAIDELVCLGDAWETRWLISSKEKILSLVKEKREAYKNAYSYLSISGVADRFIHSVCFSYFDKYQAKIKAEEILCDYHSENNTDEKNMLVSAFCKKGLIDLPVEEYYSGIKIGVFGDEYSRLLFIDVLLKAARDRGISLTRLPSPLSSCHTEGIIFDNPKLLIKRGVGEDVSADDFIYDDRLYLEKTKQARTVKADALSEAQRWLNIASELHADLENIYTRSMNFNKIDEIIERTLKKTANILGL